MVDQGLKDVGYTYINVDDGFFGYRDEQGNLCTHPKRFPNGMKAVADYIHSKGLKAGIYSDAGGNTCGSLWDKDMNGVGVGLYDMNVRMPTCFLTSGNSTLLRLIIVELDSSWNWMNKNVIRK